MDVFAPLLSEPLLSAAEEVSLAGVLVEAREVAGVVEARGGRPSAAESRVLRRGVVARERFVSANLRLVLMVVKKYPLPTGVSLDDVFQEGVVGLHRAVDKFDAGKGFRFSTYATHWIRQAAGRFLDVNATPVTISGERVSRVQQARRNGEELSGALAADAAALNVSRVVSRGVESEEGAVVDLLPAGVDVAGEVVESLFNAEMLAALDVSIAALGELDAFLVRGYYGIGCERMPYRQLGVQAGRTAEGCRRRVHAALVRMAGDLGHVGRAA